MKQNKKNKIVFILIMTILFVIAFEMLKQENYSNSNSSTQDNIIPSLTNEKFYTYNKNIFAFNKYSVKLINSDNVVWEDFVSTNNPYSIFKDGILGIGEKGGTFLNIYSEKGLLYTIKSVNKINSFSLNKNGYSAIITKENSYYEIDIYNNQGNLIFGLKNISSSEGIPISCSISSDNKFLAVSFLQTDGISANSNIVLYNLQDTSEDVYSNNLFAAFLQENQFSGIIEFIGNNHLLVISQKKVTFFKVSENISNSFWVIELNNLLKFAKIIDEKNFVLVYGEPISTQDAYENNTVVFYNISGEKLGQYTAEKNINNIETGFGSCIIQLNRTLQAISNKGKLIWEYQAIQDLNQFEFFENINKIILSSNNEVKIVDISKQSKKGNADNDVELDVNIDIDTSVDTTENVDNITEDNIEQPYIEEDEELLNDDELNTEELESQEVNDNILNDENLSLDTNQSEELLPP